MATVPVSVEHIEITPGVRGGWPRIKGSRITVQDVVLWHREGWSVERIHQEIQGLSAAGIYAALAYYHDHKEDMDRLIKEDKRRDTEMMEAQQAGLLDRLVLQLRGQEGEAKLAEVRTRLGQIPRLAELIRLNDQDRSEGREAGDD